MEVFLPAVETASVLPGPAPQGEATKAGRPEISSQVLRAAQGGDSAALEALVRHYQRPVFAFISRSLGRGPHVEDLAQETFLRVIRALGRYEERGAKLSTWIFQIAVRLMQDRRKKFQPQMVELSEHVPAAATDPERSYVMRRNVHRLEQVLAQLPDEQRMTLALVEFNNLSLDEVAQVMSCPVPTVKTRLFRARTFVKKHMEIDQESAL